MKQTGRSSGLSDKGNTYEDDQDDQDDAEKRRTTSKSMATTATIKQVMTGQQ